MLPDYVDTTGGPGYKGCGVLVCGFEGAEELAPALRLRRYCILSINAIQRGNDWNCAGHIDNRIGALTALKGKRGVRWICGWDKTSLGDKTFDTQRLGISSIVKHSCGEE